MREMVAQTWVGAIELTDDKDLRGELKATGLVKPRSFEPTAATRAERAALGAMCSAAGRRGDAPALSRQQLMTIAGVALMGWAAVFGAGALIIG
jgi:hypothetical protein